MLQPLSLIIPCYNDADAFAKTIQSIAAELDPKDELIVVDSSDDRESAQSILAAYTSIACHIRYIWTPPSGVYAAFNIGLSAASKEWVQFLNSGDCYLTGARRLISNVVSDGDCPIHVFGQIAIGGGGLSYSFFPDDRGIWPTQSVVVKKSVHSEYGPFSVRYRIVSDQLYYAGLRARYAWKMHRVLLTTYDLHGLSAKVSLDNSKELYEMWRALGFSPARSAVRAYIKPVARAISTLIGGPQWVLVMKRNLGWAFANYSKSGES